MQSLLVIVFSVEVAVHIINLIGASAINNLLWTLINYLPVPTAKAAAEQRKTQAEYLKARRELNATSSQDEFAKWAKLRRQHDKLLEQLEKSKKSLESTRSKFDSALTVARLVLTRAPQYLLPFWYAKQPMFWLPHGWFPYYAEWIISFPRAPLGSVSIAAWQLACTTIVALVSDTLRGIFGALFGSGAANRANGKVKEEPFKAGDEKDAQGTSTGTPAAAAKKRKSSSGSSKTKQEL